MLLDERRVAGGSASLGRASLPGQFGGPELRYLRRGVHLPRWRQAVLRRPQYGRMPQRVRQLRARFQGLGRHLHFGAQAAPADENLLWAYPQPEHSPYDFEWEDLIQAIREDKPYNEVKRGAEASLVGSMGRMAAHTGQIVTFDEMMNCEHEFAPGVDQLT